MTFNSLKRTMRRARISSYNRACVECAKLATDTNPPKRYEDYYTQKFALALALSNGIVFG